VVLATVAGALRLLFAGDKAVLSKSMVGAVPLSLRAPGDTTQENQVSMMLVSLATHIADPVKRMAAIRAASTRAKMLAGSMKGAIPTDLPSLGIPWLMAAITPLYRKAVAAPRIPAIANVVISNVPGPQGTLYLAGAELKAYYPVSIVTHGLALNVTIVSYDGSLDFGLVACKRTVPDLRSFAKHQLMARSAAWTVLRISMAMVMGPTPPGLGVILPAMGSRALKSTSPTRREPVLAVGSLMRFTPTSMTTAPGLTMSALTIL